MPPTTGSAGSYRHRLDIWDPSRVQSPEDVLVEDGVPAAINVVPLNFQSFERMQAGGLQASTTYTVVIRYRTDLTEAMVLHETCCTKRKFQILAIVPDERRSKLEMQCVTTGQA